MAGGRVRAHAARLVVGTSEHLLAIRMAPGALAHSRLQSMLRRKPTRIELKPDDRDEYFAHKATKPDANNENNKEKPTDKHIRIGITKPR